MAYDRDKQKYQNILESAKVFDRPDRQAPYDKIYEALVKAGFGVTRVGDRMTVRSIDWDASFALLEVRLQRDWEEDEEELRDCQ